MDLRLWRTLPFPIRLRWARLRAILGRHRRLRRLCVVGIICVMTLSWNGARVHHRNAAAAWETTINVVVVDSAHEPGEPFGDVRTRLVAWPTTLAPADALEVLPSDVGVVRRPLRPGDVLTERDLGDTTSDNADQRMIGVPRDDTMLGLAIGDLADVIVIDDPWGLDPTSSVLDPPATIVAIDDDAITLAVSPDHAEAIAIGLVAGHVGLAGR